jgi:hypothetical protein
LIDLAESTGVEFGSFAVFETSFLRGVTMRMISAVLASLLLTAVVAVAQAPKAAPPAKAPARPTATKPAQLAEVMRGVLFPNSNLLFDVQQKDPGAPPTKKPTGETGASTSETFANVYSGWQMVQAASAALDDIVDNILKPRPCSNGKPAPVMNADFKKFAAGLRKVAREARAAAAKQDKAAIEDIDNDLSDACANCHEVYRDNGPAGSPARCVAKKAAGK